MLAVHRMVAEVIVRNWDFSYAPSILSQCDWLRALPLLNVAFLMRICWLPDISHGSEFHFTFLEVSMYSFLKAYTNVKKSLHEMSSSSFQ
jgi:hypothetical protein